MSADSLHVDGGDRLGGAGARGVRVAGERTGGDILGCVVVVEPGGSGGGASSTGRLGRRTSIRFLLLFCATFIRDLFDVFGRAFTFVIMDKIICYDSYIGFFFEWMILI